jgi:hypothetical protein
MYMSRIPVKLDLNAFWSATEVGFRPVEKAEHQGCCGQIPPESDRNRNPSLDSGPPKNRMKTGMCHLVIKDGHPVMALEGILDDNMDEEDKTVWSTPLASSSVAHTHISPICLLVKK